MIPAGFSRRGFQAPPWRRGASRKPPENLAFADRALALHPVAQALRCPCLRAGGVRENVSPLQRCGMRRSPALPPRDGRSAPAGGRPQQSIEGVNGMRKLLLATAGLLVVSGGAYAEGNRRDDRRGGHHSQRTIEDYYAAALAVNIGDVSRNRAGTRDDHGARVNMTGGFSGMRGVANVNQNAGANSAQQNAVAVAYIEGCECVVQETPRNGHGHGRGGSFGDANANAVAANVGTVGGNSSQNGEEGRRGHHDGPSRRGGHGHGGGGGGVATVDMDGSFATATGVVQVNQNAGANSLQQNATAVAAVDQIQGQRQDRDAWAIAANIGAVVGNSSRDYEHRAAATMDGAFRGFIGAANVNQNAGANSAQQNATGLAAITYCNCAQEDLSTTIAAAGNFGSVAYNHAGASGGAARVSLTNSFNGLTGVAQVNQNAGANSLGQNAVAIGAIYNR